MYDIAAGQTGAGTYFYHFDGLGSVVALSNTSGVIVEHYTYDAFGNTTITTTQSYTSPGNPYMFTSRRYDAETELYHYRARTYSPELGRFLQTDPIGYADSMNLYGYVGNNPVTFIDSMGLKIQFGADVSRDDERAYNQAIKELSESQLFRNTFDYLKREDTPLVIIYIDTEGNSAQRPDILGASAIHWNRYQELETIRGFASSKIGLAHEMEHARIHAIGGIDAPRVEINGHSVNLKEENYIVQWFEGPIARELGEPYREHYLEKDGCDK